MRKTDEIKETYQSKDEEKAINRMSKRWQNGNFRKEKNCPPCEKCGNKKRFVNGGFNRQYTFKCTKCGEILDAKGRTRKGKRTTTR